MLSILLGFIWDGFVLWGKNGFSNNVIREALTKKCARNVLAIALLDKTWETVTLP